MNREKEHLATLRGIFYRKEQKKILCSGMLPR